MLNPVWFHPYFYHFFIVTTTTTILKGFTVVSFCSALFYSVGAKVAPLNINKVSNSLLNFGRKLISPALVSGGATVPVAGSSSSSFSSSSAVPIRSAVDLPQQQQQQRMMKSESMPVHLSKGNNTELLVSETESS